MNKETKASSITFGELKKMKLEMSQRWLQDLVRRYGNKDFVKVDMKDLVNKILLNHD